MAELEDDLRAVVGAFNSSLVISARRVSVSTALLARHCIPCPAFRRELHGGTCAGRGAMPAVATPSSQ